MSRGIIYIMTTAVAGLIKIGKTGSGQYQERMRFLEANGYYNVVGLKRFFAIEVEDYDDKEALLHEIFSKHRVGTSELFALEYDLVKQLLLSFDGQVFIRRTKTVKKNLISSRRYENRARDLASTKGAQEWRYHNVFSR